MPTSAIAAAHTKGGASSREWATPHTHKRCGWAPPEGVLRSPCFAVILKSFIHCFLFSILAKWMPKGQDKATRAPKREKLKCLVVSL